VILALVRFFSKGLKSLGDLGVGGEAFSKDLNS
jgi:hypothetical protein